MTTNYVVRNCLLFAYRALRNISRFVNDSHISPYEQLFKDIASALSPTKKIEFSIPNSEVEKFYGRRLSEVEFIVSVQSKVLNHVPPSGPGTVIGVGNNVTAGSCPQQAAAKAILNTFNQFSLLFTVVWEVVSTQNSGMCNKLPKLSGRQLWEVFLKLDTASELQVHVDDIVDLIVRIFQANGHTEQEESIKEWFCGETMIEFWSFFGQIVEKYVGLLQVHIVQDIHMSVVSEFLKEGRMVKKGHVVHNWKTRWFVLTASSLSYFESQENLIMKGSVVINKNAQVQHMQDYRAHPFRFRVVCGDTRNATEISAPSSKSREEWMDTIRLAIKMDQVKGRSFLHKYKQALASIQKPVTLFHSASVDNGLANGSSPKHKAVGYSQSVPLDEAPQKLPSPHTQSSSALRKITDYEEVHDDVQPPDSSEYTDAPPLPPQRVDSGDANDTQNNVFDKDAFVRARKNSKATKDRQRSQRRLSSLEPDDVDHVESSLGGIYALISKPKKKSSNKEVNELLSSAVQAQLTLEATEQIQRWGEEDQIQRIQRWGEEDQVPPLPEKAILRGKGSGKGGYVQLAFHTTEEHGRRGKILSPEAELPPPSSPAASRIDPGKTKYGYSTIVFEKEETSKPRKNKKKPPPPPIPSKYEGPGPSLSKYTSDSAISSEEFTKSCPTPASKHGSSSPDLTSPNNPTPYYVNFHYTHTPTPTGPGATPPMVPPRRGAATPVTEQAPPLALPRRPANGRPPANTFNSTSS